MTEPSRTNAGELSADLEAARRHIAALEAASGGRTASDATDQQRAEAALSESEERFRTLAEQAPIGIYLTDAGGDCTYVNARWSEMAGLTREEALGRGWLRGLHPDDRATIGELWYRSARSGDAWGLEYRLRGREGAYTWVYGTAAAVRGSHGETIGYIGVNVDISQRVQAETELSRARALLGEAEAIGHLGGWEYDVAGRRLTWTDEVYRIYGVDTEHGPGGIDRALASYAPENARLLDDAFRRAIASGAPYDLELELERTYGERIWVRTTGEPVVEAGKVVRVRGIVMDVTERRLTERLLAAPSEILGILASPAALPQIAEGIVVVLKRATGLDAVGLRLREGEDYPFAAALGYTDEFLRAENSLAVRLPDGGLCRDEDGSLSLECTCGLVLGGCDDPTNSLLKSSGSAWTNDSSTLLDLPPADDPRINPRNRCVSVGFQSLALVPLRAGDEIIGLLHLADRRKDRFTAESVRFLEGVGAGIGIALRHQWDEERIHRQHGELLRLNEELAARAAALEEANATITRVAATDDLTGLANRRHFYETLEKAISVGRRHGSPLAFVGLDLDGLKEVNDSAGHQAGDAVLTSFAALVGSLCRAEDLAARLGGDEFGLLLPGVDLAGARGLAERVLDAVRACDALARNGVTASAGIAQWTPEELPDDLLRRADEALYEAKRSGGDGVAGGG